MTTQSEERVGMDGREKEEICRCYTAGFVDGGRNPTKECKWLQEAEKKKGTNLS